MLFKPLVIIANLEYSPLSTKYKCTPVGLYTNTILLEFTVNFQSGAKLTKN